MNTWSPIRRARQFCWIPIAFAVCGCIEAPSSAPPVVATTPADLAEETWDRQVDAVREVQSDAIRVSASPITAAQWAMLADDCDALRILEADFRLLADDNLELLGTLPKLERLKLSGPIDDAALRQIARVPHLKVLNLPHGVFTDEGLRSLSALSDLELLRFGSPHVTNNGMKTIAELPSLRFLHLIDVPITNAGLESLAEISQLESFYLDGSRCTDDGLYKLLQALPDLHFHRDQLHLPADPNAHPHEKET